MYVRVTLVRSEVRKDIPNLRFFPEVFPQPRDGLDAYSGRLRADGGLDKGLDSGGVEFRLSFLGIFAVGVESQQWGRLPS